MVPDSQKPTWPSFRVLRSQTTGAQAWCQPVLECHIQTMIAWGIMNSCVEDKPNSSPRPGPIANHHILYTESGVPTWQLLFPSTLLPKSPKPIHICSQTSLRNAFRVVAHIKLFDLCRGFHSTCHCSTDHNLITKRWDDFKTWSKLWGSTPRSIDFFVSSDYCSRFRVKRARKPIPSWIVRESHASNFRQGRPPNKHHRLYIHSPINRTSRVPISWWPFFQLWPCDGSILAPRCYTKSRVIHQLHQCHRRRLRMMR